jgi:hypothetical protein
MYFFIYNKNMIQEVGGVQNSGANVPPPPSEVKVRTMRSDIDGMTKMGGGLPQFKTVAVEGSGPPRRSSFAGPSFGGGTGKAFLWWIVALGVVVLGLIAWFGYVVILKK